MEHIMKHTLTPSEWYIMEVLWADAPCTGRHIVEVLLESISWSRSTTLTILRRMVPKGLISCEEVNGVRVYSPCVQQEAAIHEVTEDFLNRVYHGNLGLMLSAFTKKQPLSQEEIDELYAILKSAKEA